ncbi:hypothetical protein [Nocardia aurea]|uniref:hypothetical protein n=1 Tax=Nocardia aurea TaxID=2144174 RepID=UPI000D6878CB|nr:hypothetical protein [Nocardia aurea]
MDEPSPELEALPGWKLRLLERIHDTSAEHQRILTENYPSFGSGDRSGDLALHTWRTNLRALESDRAELETRAAAAGLPATAIERARAAGQSGDGWADGAHIARGVSGGLDRVRGYMVDGVAADVWQLEHMAAINAERRFGRPPSRIVQHPDPGEVDQFGRNMAALWTRVNEAAHAIGLSREERAQLWERDSEGWQRLVALTVGIYDDAGLQERWRAYAWPGIEHEARRDVDSLAAGSRPGREPGVTPPTPHLLIEHASNAVIATRDREVETGQGTGEVIAAATSPALNATGSLRSPSEAEIGSDTAEFTLPPSIHASDTGPDL